MASFFLIIFIVILMEIHFIYRIILILQVPKRLLERPVMEWMDTLPCRSISENFMDCKVRTNVPRSALFVPAALSGTAASDLLVLVAYFLEWQAKESTMQQSFLARSCGFLTALILVIALGAVHLWWNAPGEDLVLYQIGADASLLWAGLLFTDTGMLGFKCSCNRNEEA